jgi:xylose isomerase
MPGVSDRYRFATRLNSFRDRGGDREATAPDLLRTVARVPGLTAVELNYPQHVQGTTEGAIAEALAETGLALTALSLRFEGPDFADGTFTSPRPETRARAIRLAQDAWSWLPDSRSHTSTSGWRTTASTTRSR